MVFSSFGIFYSIGSRRPFSALISVSPTTWFIRFFWSHLQAKIMQCEEFKFDA